MRLTANQVTLARLVLLPLPVAMVYRGGLAWMLGALAVYVLLGLTDALDGMLARRYGSTPLGALLDPIVDKIFLVAAYVPLADHRVVSIGLVSVLFVREFAVTMFRSVALEQQVTFRTSPVAKLKTTVQMAGAGFLLLLWLLRRDAVIVPLLAVATGIALLPLLPSLLRGKRPGWKAVSGAVLIAALAGARTWFGPGAAMAGIMGAIVALTLGSGLEYAWRMRSVLAARFRASPIQAFRLALSSFVVPVLLLTSALPSTRMLPLILIMGVLAAELAVGGLDNSLARVGAVRGPWPDLARSTVQASAGAFLLLAPAIGIASAATAAALWLALGLTLFDLVWRFHRNNEIFRVAAARS